jgi:flagellar L-ring protein precursor FlgH
MHGKTRQNNRPMTRRERELCIRCALLMAGVIFFSLLAAVRARAGDYSGSGGYDDRYDVMSYDDHAYAERLRGKVLGNRPVYFRQKASRVHDSVTIVVNENTQSEITSSNDLSRDTANNFTLTNWLTPSLSGGLGATQRGQAAGGSTPTFAWAGSRAHQSDSTIDRSQTFTSTLTGEVTSVLTNGYLVVQARKSVHVNGEEQVVTVTGIVNPDHMDSNSSVRAELIMDMSVQFRGNGPMTRMDKRGWWSKAWDVLTPF